MTRTPVLVVTAAILMIAGVAHADDYIRLAADTDMCIHKKSSHFNNGNGLHLYACDAGGPDNKTFIYDDATGYIHFREDPSKCIHKKYSHFNNGNPLHLWSCSGGGAGNKTFTYDAATGYIHFRQNPSKCIHKKYSNTNNGNPVHLWTCNGNDANQSWVLADELGSNAATGTTRSTLQSDIWSDWFDRDNPSGTGDGERIPEAFAEGRIPCDDPIDIQARRVGDGLFAEYTGESFTMDTTTGLVCLNADQPDGMCQDYEIRVACPMWSAWSSRDTDAGTGDYEGIASHFEDQDFACDTADEFEARRISDGVDAAATGESVTYDTTYGFACVHADQPDGQCDDYEVRVRCAVDQDGVETHRVVDFGGSFERVGLSGAGMDGVWLAEMQLSPGSLGVGPRMDPSGRIMGEGPGNANGADATVVGFVGGLDGVAGEAGQVVADDGPTTITLSRRYVAPVVFTQVASRNASDPVAAIASVNGSQFTTNTLTVRLVEPSVFDGNHGDEVVHYVVVEQGLHQTDDGKTVVVGTVDGRYAPVDVRNTALPTVGVGQDAVVVTAAQDAQRWHATASDLRVDVDGVLDRIDVMYFGDGASSDRMAYMIIGSGPEVVEFDRSVADHCASGSDGSVSPVVAGDTYGNDTVSATYSFKSGVEQSGRGLWAGVDAGIEANLLGKTVTIFDFETSASEDRGQFGSRAEVVVLGQTLIDEPIGITFDWGVTRTLFSATTYVFGVQIEGELIGTMGVEASVALAGVGVTMGATPYLDATAAATASVGGYCLSAGIGGDLSVISIGVPVETTLALSGPDVAWSIDSNLEMEALSGAIYLELDYCLDSEEHKIFKWKGIDLPDIALASDSGCF